jgi:signal transduction histidine kinase
MSAAGVAAVPKARKPWRKVHLIYFLLAAFDLLAVGGGLYLSHRLIAVFESNTAANAEWDARFNSSWALVDAVAEANRSLISAFDTGNIKLASGQFKTKVLEARHELATFTRYVDDRFPEGLVKRTNALLLKIDSLITSMETEAQAVTAEFESGNRQAAMQAVGTMQTRYGSLRFLVNDLNRLVSMVKIGRAEESEAMVARLRSFEFVIGGMIVLMVCCVVAYGHWIGRLMKTKYHALESSNEQLSRAQAESVEFAQRLQIVNDEMGVLNRELAENMRKLESAQDEIVRKGKLAQLGQLTATVAHELRNPLATVRTSVFLIERKIKGTGLTLEPQFRRIDGGIKRCDAIITQLLDFTRANTLVYDDIEIDAWLAKIVKEEAQRLPTIVRIECNLRLGPAKASIDSSRMSRVIINLLSNASEAMVGKGDDASKFVTQDPKILIESRQSARGVEVSVTDTGMGMTREILSKIREPLFTTKSFGTGLGLSAVEKILEQHGGGLDVTSTPGHGACFTAWFPLRIAESRAA